MYTISPSEFLWLWDRVLRQIAMEARSEEQEKEKPSATNCVCFCQLRDAAKGSREQWEEGGEVWGGRRRVEGGKSPQPSHQVEH